MRKLSWSDGGADGMYNGRRMTQLNQRLSGASKKLKGVNFCCSRSLSLYHVALVIQGIRRKCRVYEGESIGFSMRACAETIFTFRIMIFDLMFLPGVRVF